MEDIVEFMKEVAEPVVETVKELGSDAVDCVKEHAPQYLRYAMYAVIKHLHL